MTVEKFLSFWSQHNTSIIEGLIALIIFFALFLAYRSFFAKKDHDDVSNGNGLNSAELEKTLQKILEAQSAIAKENHAAAHDEVATVKPAAVHHEPAAAAASNAPESEAEVAQLRLTLSESQRKIEALQERLTSAESKANEAPAAAAPAEGLSSAEKEEFNNKLRDLEARLAEYEIISEDIADLSKYRDENDALKKEIEELKAGGVTQAPAAAAPAPEPVKVEEAPASSSANATQDMIDAALAAAIDNPPASAEEAVAEAMAANAPPLPDEDSSLIDDELMREFEAAVAGQKTASLEDVASKAGDGSEEAKNDGDAEKLMDEFESFVTKKS